MNFIKSVNVYRRKLTHLLTRNIGHSNNVITPLDLSRPVKRILVTRPNHRLGNMLLITPLIQDISASFPEAEIDLFVKGGIAPDIFKNYGNVRRIIQLPRNHFKNLASYIGGWLSLRKNQYDIVINVEKASSSGRLSAKFAQAGHYFFGDANGDAVAEEHIAKYPVLNFRNYIRNIGGQANDSKVPTLDLKLDAHEIAAGKNMLDDITKTEKPTISIFTYATGSKCFCESWWAAFYERLLLEFPQYMIIEILPVENVSQINFQAPTFYSKSIREIAGVIANTALFIGADSGIMHLASATQIPTVGLFSVSNLNKYGPYGNGSFSIDTNDPQYLENLIVGLRKILDPQK